MRGRPWPTLWPTIWSTLWLTLWATGGPFLKNWAQHYCKPVEAMHAIHLSHLRLSSVRVWTERGVGHGAGHGLPYGPAYGLPYCLPMAYWWPIFKKLGSASV